MTDTAVETPAVSADEAAPAEKPARQPKAPKVPTACKCSLFTGHDIKGNELSTECDGATIRTFLPGHDAKLKSLLIKSAIAEVDVIRSEDGVEQELSPVHAAEEFGFRPQVEKGLAVHQAKMEARKTKAEATAAKRQAAKDEREAAKAERKRVQDERKARAEQLAQAEKAANDEKTPGPATAKVGRNKFDGEILADGTFKYVDAKGEEVEAEKYTIVIDPATLPAV